MDSSTSLLLDTIAGMPLEYLLGAGNYLALVALTPILLFSVLHVFSSTRRKLRSRPNSILAAAFLSILCTLGALLLELLNAHRLTVIGSLYESHVHLAQMVAVGMTGLVVSILTFGLYGLYAFRRL